MKEGFLSSVCFFLLFVFLVARCGFLGALLSLFFMVVLFGVLILIVIWANSDNEKKEGGSK